MAACGNSKGTTSTHGTGTGGTGVGGADAGTSNGGGGNLFMTTGTGGSDTQGFDVEPAALQTITVTIGQTMPTIPYTATFNGSPVNAGWSVDQGSVGSITAGPSPTATFSPTGTTGGMVNVVAGAMGMTLKRKVMIKLVGTQNGPNMSPGEVAQMPSSSATPAQQVAQLSAGGGLGGVGGEGLGPAVPAGATLTALQTPTGSASAQALALVYPYDKTVWPRGMLAPLLMWTWTPGDADAIQIALKTASGSFSWTGTFAKPAILSTTPALTTGSNFVRSPIPQDVWDMATNTASGPSDAITVSLTVAKGGVGYGPISQTWTVAPGLLTGAVYYNSYGTGLVQNWGGNMDTAGNRIGAAILGIKSGELGPSVVAGQNSSDDSGCRVCHTVASKGRWLITQTDTPSDEQSYLYDLTMPNVPTSGVAMSQQGVFAWAALTGDGSYALTNEVNPSSSNGAVGTSTSSFWQFSATPTVATLTGLPSGLAAGYPSFSPDDTLIAYLDATGNTGDVAGEPIRMASYDAATQTFSNVQTLVTPSGAGTAPAFSQLRVGYPVFLPDNSGVVFESQVRQGSDSVLCTRNGARSQLWWVNAKGAPQPVALTALNGTGYLPVGPKDHGSDFAAPDPQYNPGNGGVNEMGYDDTSLNYEPTVLPVASGGYAWVVFTSRRLYGNQLGQTPWDSWPTNYNTKDLAQAPVKKLWVAAIDLNAPPGTDPSHPAFYLPAQEILAGNSRGFWVLDPCGADGSSCQTGDQCCNGYCEEGDGGLVCSNAPPGTTCSGLSQKCTTAANCCDTSNLCINGFCALSTPN